MRVRATVLGIFVLAAQRTLCAAAGTVFVPVAQSLWQVSEDGKASRTKFQFTQAHMGDGSETRLSPDNENLAFVRGPNVWLLRTPSMECIQLTAFSEWDPKSNGAQSTSIYGWTTDGKKLFIETVSADWSGEGSAPQDLRVTPLNQCKKVIRKKPSEHLEEPGKYFLEVANKKLEKTDDWPLLHADNFKSQQGAPSPDGKRTAIASDLDLMVDGKVIAPEIDPYRYWWISSAAIAVVTYKPKNIFELRVVTVPDGKVLGPYTEIQK